MRRCRLRPDISHAPFRVFIGYDMTEPIAYHVLAHSILTRSTMPVSITPLYRSALARNGFDRPRGALDSTDFSLSRFLVPQLSDYHGWSLFLDCDMLCRVDLSELLFEMIQQKDKAVLVCQHDYTPTAIAAALPACPLCGRGDRVWATGENFAEAGAIPRYRYKCGCGKVWALPYDSNAHAATKFHGQTQTAYPRKNWSSCIAFNNARCQALTGQYVNTATGLDLHRFTWIPDASIGSLPLDWNWLVGEYPPNSDAKILHYTNGGPWFANYAQCDHATLWRTERAAMLSAKEAVRGTVTKS